MVLAASVAGNVLLIGKAQSNSTVNQPVVQQRFPIAPPIPKAAPAPREPVLAAVPSLATLDRTALEDRLVAVETTLDKLIPLPEKFDTATRDPDREAALKPLLEKAFTANPATERDYAFECHGLVCRIDASGSDAWRSALSQEPQLYGAIESQLVSPGMTWLNFEKPGRAEGRTWSFNLFSALRASPEATKCKEANPTPGMVTFQLVLDHGSRSVRVVVGGPLANQAGGVCIRRVLEDLLRQTPLPSAATEVLDEPYPIRVP